MSLDLLVKRVGYTLRPWDQFAEEDMLALTGDGPIMVTLTKKRSIKHHRFYFGCLASMTRAGAPMDVDGLHNATKVKTGLIKFGTMPNGEYMVFPDSTAFDNMDQIAFNAWFPKAVQVWCDLGLIRWLAPDLLEKLREGGVVFHDKAEAA